MLKHLNHYALAIGLLINSSAFSSTRHIGDRLLEGVLPSRNLPLKRLPADFFPKYNHGEIVKHMKNGGFLVRNLLREEKSIAGFHEILPIKKPKLLRLPKSFFPESRDDVLVKRIDGRTLFVRENRQVERSRELYKRTANKLGLLGKKDRRVVVPDPLVLPFSGISLLRLTYSLFPGTQFVFYGTGFRNGVNQLLTAGHNLKLEESEIKDLCHEEGISLKNYDRYPFVMR